VWGICTHLDGQGDFANHVACVGAYHAAAENLSVAIGFCDVLASTPAAIIAYSADLKSLGQHFSLQSAPHADGVGWVVAHFTKSQRRQAAKHSRRL